MPTLARPFCRQPGCRVLVRSGFCRAHQQTSARAFPDAHGWYKLARWRHPIYGLRSIVLREQAFCAGCRRLLIDGHADVDHIVPHRGDPALFWDRANLQGLCHDCHAAKTRAGA